MSDSPEPIVVGEDSISSARRAASSSKMLREGGKLGLLTLASRVLGLVREMTRAAFMGTGALADAFTVAFNLPNFLPSGRRFQRRCRSRS